MNLTVSVIYSCSSRCKTCNVWQKRADNLSVDEYERVFSSLGTAPAWVTVSGGDPFLRADLPEIVRLIRKLLRPNVINIPISGILTKRIETQLPQIARHTVGTRLVLNFSIDDVGARQDTLRGHPGSYTKTVQAYGLARDLQREYPHVVLGVNTVISKWNVHRIPEISDEIARLEPDSYVTEIAEARAELGTTDAITPSAEAYGKAVDYLSARMRERPSRHPVGRLVQALRLEYYSLTKRTLEEKTQVIPCYAGWASAHLAPDGDVWGCCTRAEPLGNVRDNGYRFEKVWFSAEADRFRDSVRAKECACPLASAAYTNMLLSPRSLLRVVRSEFGRAPHEVSGRSRKAL